MKKLVLIPLILIFLSGCATATKRLFTYKEQNKNIAQVEIACDIPAAKDIVRQVIKESNFFVERLELEKDNFIFANTGYGNYLKMQLNLSLFPQIYYTRLGFFFDYNDNVTTITITEETNRAALLTTAHIHRYELAEKIKLKALKL